jgi:hypothetical protein
LWVWGYNPFGEMGLGDDGDDYLTPQHLLPPSGYDFSSISVNANGYQAVSTLTAVPESSTFVLAGGRAYRLARVCPAKAHCQFAKSLSSTDSVGRTLLGFFSLRRTI